MNCRVTELAIIENSFYPERQEDFRDLLVGNIMVSLDYIHKKLADRNYKVFLEFLECNLYLISIHDSQLARSKAVSILRENDIFIYGGSGYIVLNKEQNERIDWSVHMLNLGDLIMSMRKDRR